MPEPDTPSEEALWAWAAGLFEGEGSVINAAGRLSVKMTDEDVVRRLHSIVGGRVYGPYSYDTQVDGSVRKPAWMWVSDGADPGAILRRWWPWLGARRRERAIETGLLHWMELPDA